MQRHYIVEIVYNSRGNRYELVEIERVTASNAGLAANRAFRQLRDRLKGNTAKRIREVLGGTIKINVTAASRTDGKGGDTWEPDKDYAAKYAHASGYHD